MFGKPSRKDRHKLESEGRSASATVLAIADRGMSLTSGNGDLVANTEVILKTRLRVEPVGEPAFEVEKKFRYAQMSIPSVGTPLGVRYDPDDHDTILIEDVPTMVKMGGVDLNVGSLLSTIKDTKAAHPNDRMAMATSLQAALGAQGLPVGTPMMPATMFAAGGFGAPDEVGQLERLAALHSSGALTDAEFAAEKAKLLS